MQRLIATLLVPLLALSLASCKPRPEGSDSEVLVRQSEREARTVAPKTMYHIGPRRYLEPYGRRDGTFQNAEWNAIGSTRNQAPYRRGFYVSQNPGYNEIYGLESLTAKDDPWLLAVTLKEECRTSRMLPDLLSPLPGEFFDFFTASSGAPLSAQQFRSRCQKADVIGHRVEHADTKVCTDTVEQVLRAKNYGVIYDHWWPKLGFWYVRDPSCIEKLDSSPKMILNTFVNVPNIFGDTPFFDGEAKRVDGDKSGAVLLSIMLHALVEFDASKVSGDTWSALAKKFESNNSTDDLDIGYARYANQSAHIALNFAAICAMVAGPRGVKEYQNNLKSFLATEAGDFQKGASAFYNNFARVNLCNL